MDQRPIARLRDFWPNAAPEQQGPDIIIYPEPIESWAQRRRRLLWLANPCCMWCGFLFVDPDFATIEHIIPKAYGGGNVMSNTRLACDRCNERRGQWYSRTLLTLERRRALANKRERPS